MQLKMDKSKNLIIVSIAVMVTAILIGVFILKPAKPKKPGFAPKPRIAIVIDDWGYGLNNLSAAKEIRYPMTCAVLPNLRNSKTVAVFLHSAGFEVILHLPMEPKEKYGLEKNTILVTSTPRDIRAIISQDLKGLVFAKGVSNHMGSRVTENRDAVTVVLRELSRRNLYFLDSFVTARTQAFRQAKRIGLRCARRDVFLDNVNDPVYIKAQINKLKLLAKSRGFAIGIGHDRKNTLKVLSQVMLVLAKEGYRFVFVSELAR